MGVRKAVSLLISVGCICLAGCENKNSPVVEHNISTIRESSLNSSDADIESETDKEDA